MKWIVDVLNNLSKIKKQIWLSLIVPLTIKSISIIEYNILKINNVPKKCVKSSFLYFEGQTFKNASFYLYELGSGKLVYNETIGYLGNNTLINFTKANLSQGIYLAEINTENGIIYRQKLTIE